VRSVRAACSSWISAAIPLDAPAVLEQVLDAGVKPLVDVGDEEAGQRPVDPYRRRDGVEVAVEDPPAPVPGAEQPAHHLEELGDGLPVVERGVAAADHLDDGGVVRGGQR
jgi:hypothetical protein